MQMMRNEYRIDEPKSGFRNSVLLILGLLVVTALVLGIYYYTKVNRAATSESREVRVSIAKGSSTRQIATDLENQKVISNKNIFIIYSKLHNAGGKIQAGDYLLNSNMTVAEVVDVLTAGKVAASGTNVTIVEGLNNKQIGNYLVSRGIIQNRSDLENVLDQDNFNFKFETEAKQFNYQGFLFPDTYKLSKDKSVADLVSKMLNNFESKISDQMLTDIQKQNRKLSNVLILASIIEKEVGRNKEKITAEDLQAMNQERKLVASVFYNRLQIGMALESDATVNYITGKADRSVTIEDTKIKSPYNTYRQAGLPPAPISNPGLDSIMSAIYPADTDYLYFLNAPDGTAYFAKTLAEHNANKARYLK
ncbi:MAG: endolytic transglycosylase MltG [Candidatus Doudnabacteria bacterium]|nr:endolytic transglycosylase MltG [Candidatus Doudnabacteria bacterium]